MNFHPDILDKAAFRDRPRSLKDLYRVVGLIEENVSVSKERQRLQQDARGRSRGGVEPRDVSRVARQRQEGPGTISVRCWSCGQAGHYQRGCPQRTARPGNGQRPGGRSAPEEKFLSSLHKITALPSDSPLWGLKVGNDPALVDTGPQFSCVRSGVGEFLYLIGELCEFLSCSACCTLVDGTRCKVTDTVKLHVKLLKFSWDQEFKVLKGGPFPVILGLDFLRRTKMVLDVSTKRFSFGFAPDCSAEFCSWMGNHEGESYLQNLTDEASQLATG